MSTVFTPCIVRIISFVKLECCNQCDLTCVLWTNNFQHFTSNCGVFASFLANLYSHWLKFWYALVILFHALVMFMLLFRFFKYRSLFRDISLTSQLFSLLILTVRAYCMLKTTTLTPLSLLTCKCLFLLSVLKVRFYSPTNLTWIILINFSCATYRQRAVFCCLFYDALWIYNIQLQMEGW
jgi:hypothetical protein